MGNNKKPPSVAKASEKKASFYTAPRLALAVAIAVALAAAYIATRPSAPAAAVGNRPAPRAPQPAAANPAPVVPASVTPPPQFRVLDLDPPHPQTPADFVDVYPVLKSVRDNPDLKVTVLAEAPLILQIDDFLSPSECTALIALMKAQGLQRSTVLGGVNEKGFKREYSEVRTSSNTWCMEPCWSDPTVIDVSERVMRLLHRPSRLYAEHWQMLEYRVGEYYKEHNDYIPSQREYGGGSRIFTFYMYLNNVTRGGETEFVHLGIKVQPKVGRAVLWPNVRYHPSINAGDDRTDHQALPVLEGVKYGANYWIHVGDFQTPFARGEAP